MPTFVCLLRAHHGHVLESTEKVVPVWGDTNSEVIAAMTDTSYELFPRSDDYHNHKAELFELSTEVLTKMLSASRPEREIRTDDRNGIQQVWRDV